MIAVAFRTTTPEARQFIESIKLNVIQATRLAYGADATRRETYQHYSNHPDPTDQEREAWMLSLYPGLEDIK